MIRVLISLFMLPVLLTGGFVYAADDKPTGEIVFVSDRDGNYEIYTMSADGNNQINLSNNPADDESPLWSPDGEWIAFLSDRDLQPSVFSLYTMKSDGTEIKRLLSDNLAIYPEDFGATGPAFSWSPDGTKIAVAPNNENFERRVYIIDFATNIIEQRSQNDAFSPVWSADGEWIGFPSKYSSDRFWSFGVVSTDGKFETVIFNDGDYPSTIEYQTDSQHLIDFNYQAGDTRYDNIYTVSMIAPTGHCDNPPCIPIFTFEQHDNLAYSYALDADGQKTVNTQLQQGDWELQSVDEAGNWEIYVHNVVTDELIRLTDNTFWDGNENWRPQPTTPESS